MGAIPVFVPIVPYQILPSPGRNLMGLGRVYPWMPHTSSMATKEPENKDKSDWEDSVKYGEDDD